jgi:two-component system sensor histidine kinase BaeS
MRNWRGYHGGQPPWWPEGEEWPPRDGWPAMGRNFRRRLALAALALFLLVFGAGAAAGALLAGMTKGGGPIVALAVGGILLLVLLLSIGGRAARGMTAPIGEVMEAAGRLAAGDYSVRVRLHGPREVRGLASAFNAMAERLQANEERRRNLLADIAHELRTPLAVIRGNAEGLLDGVYPADEAHLGPIIEETIMIARLLDDLSILSTAQAGALPLHRERLSAAELIEESMAAFRPQADAAGIILTTKAGTGLPTLDVDSVRIREVLDNLLSNALRHIPPGGSVTVSVEAADGSVRFEVSDTGSGIAREQLPFVFERFRRSADSHGSGLGLAIAKSLVEAHGGTISAESTPGQGTTIRFELPVELK